jgi:farnesyl diphosphate synthase
MRPETAIEHYRTLTEQALTDALPDVEVPPERLHRAMRYAVLGGGKRLRPVLVQAAGAATGVEPERLAAPAVAVEFIHAYSLVHDDLPAMDDDDLRRGRPTCHKAFDEATAILAGDALQALAFQVLAEDHASPPEARLQRLQLLAEACGSRGMAGGQALDLEAVGRELELGRLEAIHSLKTGALIRASVLLGALGNPGLAAAERAALDEYAAAIGLAFQIQDDILDVTTETATLGKMRGADLARGKPTYPSLLGLEKAQALALKLAERAVERLRPFDDRAGVLRWLADYVVRRGY